MRKVTKFKNGQKSKSLTFPMAIIFCVNKFPSVRLFRGLCKINGRSANAGSFPQPFLSIKTKNIRFRKAVFEKMEKKPKI